MKEYKPKSTAMVTREVKNRNNKVKLNTEDPETINEIKKVSYREAIGSLMYLTNAILPDIFYAVNYLARKQLEPAEGDWNYAKRIFKYLGEKTDLGIRFMSTSKHLEALTDSSFRDCKNLTSTGGCIINLFDDVTAWRSHQQSSKIMSTYQVEEEME